LLCTRSLLVLKIAEQMAGWYIRYLCCKATLVRMAVAQQAKRIEKTCIISREL